MHITRRAALLGAGASALAGATAFLPRPGFGQPASSRWQAATGFAEGNYHTRNLRQFIAELREATGGAIDMQLHPNGSLLQQPQIKRGVQTGQVQLGEILMTAYGNEDPFFDADAVPGLVADFNDARRLAEVQRPFVEARFQRQGMTVLYLAPWPFVGITSNAPLANAESLRGIRLRTYSPISNRLAQLLGAQAVLVTAPEVPQAFATGIVQAQLTTAPVAADTSVWDYSRVFTNANIATSKNAVFANRRALEALPEASRAAIMAAAARAEARAWTMAAEAQAEAEARMTARGVQVQPAAPALREALREAGRVMTEEWVQRAGEDGRKLIEAYRGRA